MTVNVRLSRVLLSNTPPAVNVRISKVVLSNNGGASIKSVRVAGVALRPGQSPGAAFTSTVSYTNVLFDASLTTTDPAATVATYAWNFGDGTTGSGIGPTHTYSAAGSYTVILTVTDTNGSSGTVSHSITATTPPVVALSAPLGTGNVTSAAQLSGTALTISQPANLADRDLLIAVICNRDNFTTITPPSGWTLFSPSGATTNSTLLAYYKYVPAKSGEPGPSYTWNMSSGNRSIGQIFRVVGAKASSIQDASGTIVSTLTTSLSLPALTTNSHGSLVVAVVVSHSATGTASNLSAPISLVDNGQISVSSSLAATTLDVATLVTPMKGLVGPLTYGIDIAPSVAEGFTFSVAAAAPPTNQPPVAAFTSTQSGLVLTLDSSTSSDPDGSVVGYAWTFGDGSTATGPSPTHTYSAPGTYSVTLAVTDQDGATGSVTKSRTMTSGTPPVASVTAHTYYLTVYLDASGSTDTGGTIFSYTWDFGDGTTGTGAVVSHTYGSAGTYPVKLTIIDNNGGTAVLTASYTVTTPPSGLPVRMFFRENSDGTVTPLVYVGQADGAGNVLGTRFDGTWNGSTIITPYSTTPITGPGTYPNT